VMQDVTQFRRAEELALERLNELESLYRNAPVGLCLVDRDLRYLRVNQAIADINGLAIADVVGKTYRDLSPETADAAEPYLRELMERGESVRNVEVRSVPPTDPGVEHVYLMSIDPVRDARGEVVGHTSAVQDEILYAHTPVGLCHMDPQLRIVHVNPLFAVLGSAPAEAQVGRPVQDFLPESVAGPLLAQLRYVLRSGSRSAELHVRATLPGEVGRERVWLAHSHPVHDRGGAALRGIVTVLQDVSVLVERQREVEVMRDRLAEAQGVSAVGSWEWNLVDDTFWWSPELYEIFGVDPGSEISYSLIFERIHADDRDLVREQMALAFQGQLAVPVRFRIETADGARRPLLSASRLVRDARGVPVKLLGTCQDLTPLLAARSYDDLSGS